MGSSLSLHQTRLVYNDTAHTYMLNGRRCKSVTAVAKIAPDSYALEQWRKRQVAIGMMHEPRLAERVAVDPDNRELVDGICEEAMRIAGSHHAADRGTQRHRAAELFDLGRPLITDQQRADALAWQRTIERHGLEILPEHVEGFAAWPKHGVTGRFDRLARYNGRIVCVDLKSGENAVKYPQGTAVQLALYARAPMISAEVTTVGDQSTVTRWTTPPADLDLEVAYVILLGEDMELGELWKIDIAHGWAGAQEVLALIDWRKAHGYGRLLAEQVKPEPAPDDLLELIAAAPHESALTDLWRSASTWTQQHTAAAVRRKAALKTSPAVAGVK